MSNTNIDQSTEAVIDLVDRKIKDESPDDNDNFEISVRKIDFPIKPRGVLAE